MRLLPLHWTVVVAFSPRAKLLTTDVRLWPRRFTCENFDRVFSAFPVATWFGNSVAIALVVTAPVQVIMVSQFVLVTDLGLYGTYWAVILPTAASAFGSFWLASHPRHTPGGHRGGPGGRRRRAAHLRADSCSSSATAETASSASVSGPVEHEVLVMEYTVNHLSRRGESGVVAVVQM